MHARETASTNLNTAPVAVIVPVADRPRLVCEALDSIVQGRIQPREIVIVLNASVASGRDADRYAVQDWIAERSARLHPDVQCRHTDCDRQGPAAARNRGAALIQQPWLAFLDSDDLWHPDKLARQLAFLKQRPHLNVCHTREVWQKAGRILTQPIRLRPRTGRFLMAAMQTCLISCSAVLMRTALFHELNGFDEDYFVCEDFEFWLRLLHRMPVGLVDEALTIKRSGDWPQLSQNHSLDYNRVRALLKFWQNHDLSAQERAEALRSMRAKLDILLSGARQHENGEHHRRIAALEDRFRAITGQVEVNNVGV
ncbi:MAG: glycosyltransferase family 2 protein [Leptospiraceae bacterium]|nr:glycosyltransferase family 2 protein [Leptospiraceae bacterium]